jgi:hypothetical protein
MSISPDLASDNTQAIVLPIGWCASQSFRG